MFPPFGHVQSPGSHPIYLRQRQPEPPRAPLDLTVRRLGPTTGGASRGQATASEGPSSHGRRPLARVVSEFLESHDQFAALKSNMGSGVDQGRDDPGTWESGRGRVGPRGPVKNEKAEIVRPIRMKKPLRFGRRTRTIGRDGAL